MNTNKGNRALFMLSLILSGEAIFFLPFVLPRIFKPTVLEVFDINNFELGVLFSIYGVVALISYLLGGFLADKYSPRILISISLLLTGSGGLYLSSLPGMSELKFLYGFWGASTIFLFWSAMIKATRIWGGDKKQGRAFSLLDGGRGLSAAIISSVAVFVLSISINKEGSLEEKTEALKLIIKLFSYTVIIIGVLSYLGLNGKYESKNNNSKLGLLALWSLITKPKVFLQAIIILCAYVGYKITDDFSLYASDVLNFSDSKSAAVGTIALWMRPVVALLAVFFSDKIVSSKYIKWSFILLILSSLAVASGKLPHNIVLLFAINLILICLGIYSIRSLYFALIEEAKIPINKTGAVVGIISVIGFTPDIFIGPWTGVLLDNNPGELGHQYVFLLLSLFSLMGLLAVIWFRRILGD
jgi:MFS family permease